MKHWVGGLAVLMVVLVSAFAREGEAPSAQQQPLEPNLGTSAGDPTSTSGTPPIVDSVQLRHELIEIRIPARTPSRHRAVTRPAAPRAEVSRPPRFVERARRALVGDGRYRPEPFPKPGTH